MVADSNFLTSKSSTMNSKVAAFAILLLGYTGQATGTFTQNPKFSIIPFKLAGKLVYVKAWANGRPGNFIIDTGLQGVLLNNRYFEGERSSRVVYGINGQAKEVGVKYVSLRLEKINFPQALAEVAGLNHIEEQIPGTPIMGLIGGDFFMDYELAFDFTQGEMTLCRLDEKGRKLNPPLPYAAPSDTVRIEFKGHLPCIKAQVGEEVLCFAIDSGSGPNVLHQKCLKKVAAHLKNQKAIQILGLSQQREPAIIGTLTGLQLGNVAYLPMETIVMSIAHFNNTLFGPQLDGILGFHFLRQYKIAINLKRKELYLWCERKKNVDPAPIDLVVKKQ